MSHPSDSLTFIVKEGFRAGGKNYKPGKPAPVRYSRWDKTAQAARAQDPSHGVPGASPNFGRTPTPHIITFNSLLTSIAKAYRNPDEAWQDSEKNAQIMLNDPMIWGPIFARQRMVALLDWTIESEDDKDKELKAAADRLKKRMEKTPFFTKYRWWLSSAIWYGRVGAFHEFQETRDRAGHRSWTVKRWQPVSGDKLVFRYDDGQGTYDRDQVGVKVSPALVKGDKIAGDRVLEWTIEGPVHWLQYWERERMIVHKHFIRDGDYRDPITAGQLHGIGLRSYLYWTWYQKQEAMAQLMEIVERSSMGFTIYYYQRGNDTDKANVKKIAEEQSRTNIILMPYDPADPNRPTIDQIPMSSQGIDALMRLIDTHFDDQITRSVLGQTLSTKASATGLGSGLADLHQDSLSQVIKFDAINLEEAITAEYLRKLVEFNEPKYRNVDFKFRIQTDSKIPQEMLAATQAIWQMGGKIKLNDVMEAVGLEVPSEDDKTVFNPQIVAAIEQAEQAEEAGEAGMMGGPELPQAMPGMPIDGDGDGLTGQVEEGDVIANAEMIGEMQQQQQFEKGDPNKVFGPIMNRKRGAKTYKKNGKEYQFFTDRPIEDLTPVFGVRSGRIAAGERLEAGDTVYFKDGKYYPTEESKARRYAKRNLINEGTFTGKWGGYQLEFNDGERDHNIRTGTGVRGIDIPVQFDVKNGSVVEESITVIKPDRYAKKRDIDSQVNRVEKNPSEKQKEAGNYRKGHVSIQGLPITIETVKGERRRPEWPEMPCHYGYIKQTTGADGDHFDVFIGQHEKSPVVFVADHKTKDGRFDEHKAFVGFLTEKAVRTAYRNSYTKAMKLGQLTPMTIDQFRNWIDEGDLSKPIAKQVSRYSRTAARKAVRYAISQQSLFDAGQRIPKRKSPIRPRTKSTTQNEMQMMGSKYRVGDFKRVDGKTYQLRVGIGGAHRWHGPIDKHSGQKSIGFENDSQERTPAHSSSRPRNHGEQPVPDWKSQYDDAKSQMEQIASENPPHEMPESFYEQQSLFNEARKKLSEQHDREAEARRQTPEYKREALKSQQARELRDKVKAKEQSVTSLAHERWESATEKDVTRNLGGKERGEQPILKPRTEDFQRAPFEQLSESHFENPYSIPMERNSHGSLTEHDSILDDIQMYHDRIGRAESEIDSMKMYLSEEMIAEPYLFDRNAQGVVRQYKLLQDQIETSERKKRQAFNKLRKFRDQRNLSDAPKLFSKDGQPIRYSSLFDKEDFALEQAEKSDHFDGEIKQGKSGPLVFRNSRWHIANLPPTAERENTYVDGHMETHNLYFRNAKSGEITTEPGKAEAWTNAGDPVHGQYSRFGNWGEDSDHHRTMFEQYGDPVIFRQLSDDEANAELAAPSYRSGSSLDEEPQHGEWVALKDGTKGKLLSRKGQRHTFAIPIWDNGNWSWRIQTKKRNDFGSFDKMSQKAVRTFKQEMLDNVPLSIYGEEFNRVDELIESQTVAEMDDDFLQWSASGQNKRIHPKTADALKKAVEVRLEAKADSLLPEPGDLDDSHWIDDDSKDIQKGMFGEDFTAEGHTPEEFEKLTGERSSKRKDKSTESQSKMFDYLDDEPGQQHLFSRQDNPVRYSMPGMPGGGRMQEGTRKSMGGREYILHNSRWHRADDMTPAADHEVKQLDAPAEEITDAGQLPNGFEIETSEGQTFTHDGEGKWTDGDGNTQTAEQLDESLPCGDSWRQQAVDYHNENPEEYGGLDESLPQDSPQVPEFDPAVPMDGPQGLPIGTKAGGYEKTGPNEWKRGGNGFQTDDAYMMKSHGGELDSMVKAHNDMVPLRERAGKMKSMLDEHGEIPQKLKSRFGDQDHAAALVYSRGYTDNESMARAMQKVEKHISAGTFKGEDGKTSQNIENIKKSLFSDLDAAFPKKEENVSKELRDTDAGRQTDAGLTKVHADKYVDQQGKEFTHEQAVDESMKPGEDWQEGDAFPMIGDEIESTVVDDQPVEQPADESKADEIPMAEKVDKPAEQGQSFDIEPAKFDKLFGEGSTIGGFVKYGKDAWIGHDSGGRSAAINTEQLFAHVHPDDLREAAVERGWKPKQAKQKVDVADLAPHELKIMETANRFGILRGQATHKGHAAAFVQLAAQNMGYTPQGGTPEEKATDAANHVDKQYDRMNGLVQAAEGLGVKSSKSGDLITKARSALDGLMLKAQESGWEPTDDLDDIRAAIMKGDKNAVIDYKDQIVDAIKHAQTQSGGGLSKAIKGLTDAVGGQRNLIALIAIIGGLWLTFHMLDRFTR